MGDDDQAPPVGGWREEAGNADRAGGPAAAEQANGELDRAALLLLAGMVVELGRKKKGRRENKSYAKEIKQINSNRNLNPNIQKQYPSMNVTKKPMIH